MRAGVLVWAALVCVSACQRGESDAPRDKPAPAPAPTPAPTPAAPDPAAFRRDVDRICNVAERAGIGQEGVNPDVAQADWLAENIETNEARALIREINGLPAAQRAAAYDAVAAKVGLTGGCPTARAWDNAK
jgi:hypothetical protein